MFDSIVSEDLVRPLIYMSRIEIIHPSGYADIDVFGEMMTLDIDDIFDMKRLPKLKNWFDITTKSK